MTDNPPTTETPWDVLTPLVRETVLVDGHGFVIERPGEKQPRTVDVQLQGERTPLGLSWHFDEAEPGVAIVNRVVAGSASARAGVRLNDRILSVSGATFSSTPELSKLLEGAVGGVSLQVERTGRLQTVRISVRARSTPHRGR